MYFRNLKKSFLSIIYLGLITGCSAPDINILPDSTNISSVSFDLSSLRNKNIGKWENFKLRIGNSVAEPNGYQDENSAVNAMVKLKQTSIFSKSQDYVLISANSKYYIYELIQYNSNLTDNENIKSYSDFRNVKLENFKDFNIVALSSTKGQVRFTHNQPSNSTYQSQAKNPTEALNRLIQMEKNLSATQDHRGLFATMYRVITQRAIKELENYKKEGNLKAADFEEKLLVNFANRYFLPFDKYASGNISEVPEVWRAAFDSGRKSQNLGLKKSGNIAEIYALSMCAHIIHDLPFTLKDINYDVKDPVLKSTFDRFNTVLFEEKDNILKAVKNNYGDNIVQKANDFFGPIGNFTMQKVFSVMRGIASNEATYLSKEGIVKTSLSFSDGILKIIPGGNSKN